MVKDPHLKEKIQAFEDELKHTRYNKRTQGSIGLLKAKIARLKEEHVKKGSKRLASEGFGVRKSGDATCVMVGFPSVGKSTILNKITGANSEVGAYDFTTVDVIPGTLEYGNVKIQIFDVPGLIEGASEGKGRGREILTCVMVADMVILIVDATKPEQLPKILAELYKADVRLNKKKPAVKLDRRPAGGIHISSVKLTKMDKKTLLDILREFKYNSADIIIRDDIDADQLIDVIEGNKRYIPGLLVLNKIDLIPKDQLERLKAEIRPDVCISAEQSVGIEELKRKILEKLQLTRVYCKEVGKKAESTTPLVLKGNRITLRDACLEIHKDFLNRFKFARIWGKSARFDGQAIQNLDHKLADNDILEIHIK